MHPCVLANDQIQRNFTIPHVLKRIERVSVAVVCRAVPCRAVPCRSMPFRDATCPVQPSSDLSRSAIISMSYVYETDARSDIFARARTY